MKSLKLFPTNKVRLYLIYSIRNTVTDRLYIGSTIKLNQRIETHFIRLRKGLHLSTKMQDDYQKYGEESFVVEILNQVGDRKKLFLYEKIIIANIEPKYNNIQYRFMKKTNPFNLYSKKLLAA